MNAFKKTLLAIAITSSSFTAFASQVELDRVITIVNDGVILSSDVEALKRNVKLNAGSKQLPSDEVLEKQILDQLIFEQIQVQEAKRLGIQVTDSLLDDAINNIAREKNVTLSQLRVELQRMGINWSDYREQIRKEISISEIRNAQVKRRINILPQEIDALSKQLIEKNQKNTRYHISQIQIRLDENASKTERDTAFKKAKAIIQELKNGADFGSLALAKSNGPRALNGGNWGWMRIEEMPTIFAEQIKDHKAGSIIGPFRSGVGYHVLKIDDMEGLKPVSVTEINARHILIKPTIVLSDRAIEKQLTDVTSQINSGKMSFADAARQLSADSGSAAKGGELGWQTPDLYVPEFKSTIERLPKGKISQPFKTVHGWHIVEVLDKRTTDRTDAAVKNRAYQLLMNRKFSEETQAWLQELRAGAYIENLGSTNDNY